MPEIEIQGTVIDFPDTGASPVWSDAVVQFAEATADALSAAVGTFDVAPQRFVLDSVPNNVATDITNLSFSTAAVRGAYVYYTIYRHTSTTTLTETGQLTLSYNPSNTVGQLWDVTRKYAGQADVVFTVSDVGQVAITTTSMTGTGYTAFVSYFGKALQNSY